MEPSITRLHLRPMLGLLALLWLPGAVAQNTNPADQPLPDINSIVADPRRALIIEAQVEDGLASLVEAFVSSTPPPGYSGAPAQLRLRWFDGAGTRLGTRNAWDPRWEYEEDEDGGERRNLLPSAIGVFEFPFSKEIARVELTEVASGLVLLDINVANVVQEFCIANPDDPNCEGIDLSDLDGDGVPNDSDNCPNDANPDQADADNDGLGDVCDPTPNGDPEPGDINGDNVIDTEDYNAIRSTLGKCDGDAGYLPTAEFTGDGCVAFDDYQLWYQTYYAPDPPPGPGC